MAYLDRKILFGRLYEGVRDPEGLLSNIPAIGTALLGLLAGLWLSGRRAAKANTLGLAIGAAACLATGYFWSIWFPTAKSQLRHRGAKSAATI